MQSDDKQWEYMVTAEKMTIEAIEAYQTGEATAKELENDIKDIEYFLERVDDAICKT